ncbi:MAG TPA: thioesterase family protein [Kiritimatiellia bacterium]|nr:thioesterase family protein [Kiritimatiellia bacterium]HRZ13231.1 thioesterase family protein [Kiritimatiellia bacterium]HSA18680.1 thioesterase family protein [Kiritimatiellia bacterium]
MYKQPYRIRMHDTDAAGILFFTSQLRIAHETFEAFLDGVGLGLGVIMGARDYRIPIVHAESDYRAPVHLGDLLSVEVALARVGRTSFALRTRFVSAAGLETGAVTTVQVAVDARTWQKRPLPDELRRALAAGLS